MPIGEVEQNLRPNFMIDGALAIMSSSFDLTCCNQNMQIRD